MALIKPPKFRFLPTSLKSANFRLLDVGAGSHSASKTKKWYPHCEYHGIDITRNYENDENDFKAMSGFYEMDLTRLEFSSIPDNYFDVIMMSHIIEHLSNGDQVIQGLLPKLKTGGFIYIEYPAERSTRLPSMKRTLNFYDDPTHVRIYSVPEVAGILEKSGFSVLRQGTRRYWPYIVLLPLTLVTEFLKYRFIPGGVFWDIAGFAEFVFARKK
ncbi:MAG: class I SAM-dependent methyltransferase [Bacteroidetes bacterium]|nr:class I SAM-dependent methyltransferase [Bacteroidota bacterium]